jgi:hypothetical protein
MTMPTAMMRGVLMMWRTWTFCLLLLPGSVAVRGAAAARGQQAAQEKLLLLILLLRVAEWWQTSTQ